VAARPLLLPEGSVLLHIGMYKTGTSAIQGALFQARPHLAEHGVVHAGKSRHPMGAVLALIGRTLRGAAAPPTSEWQALVDQVAAASDKRVIVSSEFLGDVNPETARRAVRELGGPRVHVVVTLRPLVKVMPSQWQTYVRNGSTTSSYDDWLEGMLKRAPYKQPTPSFWKRNHHEVLVENWASIVGPENMTVIVVDEADRNFLFRTFEELVGLPSGLLVAERNTENRSLTLGEIELVRQISIEFLKRGWSAQLYRRVILKGLARHVSISRTPRADEPRIVTPQWALDRAAEIGAAAADKLPTLGVRIVGDVSTLGAPALAEEPREATNEEVVLPVEAARQAVIGTILASGVTTARIVDSTSTRELLRVVLGRGWGRLRRTPR
jgi:hypothetical protein